MMEGGQGHTAQGRLDHQAHELGQTQKMLSATINRKHIKSDLSYDENLLSYQHDGQENGVLGLVNSPSMFPSVSQKSGEIATGQTICCDCQRCVVVSQTTTPDMFQENQKGPRLTGWGFSETRTIEVSKRSYRNTCKASSSARKASQGLDE